MEMLNNDIYGAALKLDEAFSNNDLILPAKLNYYLTKNKNLIFALALEIERVRQDTINNDKYSEEDKSQQLKELSLLSQDVDIKKIPLSWLTDDIKFSNKQMEAIMFMIDENA